MLVVGALLVNRLVGLVPFAEMFWGSARRDVAKDNSILPPRVILSLYSSCFSFVFVTGNGLASLPLSA